MSDITRIQARKLLKAIAGRSAEFRSGQLEAISALVDERRRVLVVQRTGWGKSAVYFIATSILRQRGGGPTVIVSPLIALMRNQVEMTAGLDLVAETVNSTNPGDWERIFEMIDNDNIDLLLISPERLNNPGFVKQALPQLTGRLGLLVVDEVHCISDWGHDFRPDYRRLGKVVGLLPPNIPVLGTTATANERVVKDVAEQLGGDLVQIRGPLDRESLELQVIRLPERASRMAWLAAAIPSLPGSGIVYCLTVRDADRIGEWLRSRDIDAVTYTGRTDDEKRRDIERRLTDGAVKVVVATSALGMGYDNPHIEFVVHYQTPGSPVAYYQQVGRAGRVVDHSYGILLGGPEDSDIQDYFIRTAFPDARSVERVMNALVSPGGLSTADIDTMVNLSRGRLVGMLKVLEVEGAVYREGRKWYRSARAWEYPEDRVAAVIAQRKVEQATMQRYLGTDECLMTLLRGVLDDLGVVACGRCSNCTGTTLPVVLSEGLLAAATAFLERSQVPIRPRRRWPYNLGGPSLNELGLAEGKALTVWGDPGLAQLVEFGKYDAGVFDDPLVDALAEMVANWSPDPHPTWVTWVPAFGGGGPVADLALRLGDRLGLPVHEAVQKTVQNHPQKDMENGYHQASNVRGAFDVLGNWGGHVLLVDDLVDSRWTFTVIGSLLRQKGVETVYPVALADTSRGGA